MPQLSFEFRCTPRCPPVSQDRRRGKGAQAAPPTRRCAFVSRAAVPRSFLGLLRGRRRRYRTLPPCVRAFVHACVRACVRACVCACVRVGETCTNSTCADGGGTVDVRANLAAEAAGLDDEATLAAESFDGDCRVRMCVEVQCWHAH